MALYLKYRPNDFHSLVGQDFIKNTLLEAVKSDKTVGAYLFCGPRGTGKTSTARIMAKALNCKKIKDGNPCNKCEICKAINNENLVDVIEIDAASHTGVDNIRDLIERAQFSPSHSKYKVYIIDEVHMLSKGAFNALLKTLEEPPKHVKFILATTETHKVPDTIISRCQRFDFSRISRQDIKKRLEYIAKQEGIETDSESLDYISQNSGGGLRNAISLFEQLISNSKIKYDTIIDTLGIVNKETLASFLDKLLNKDSSIIKDIDDLISKGKNLKLFFKELIFFLRDETIRELNNTKDISKYIFLLETLDDTYSKTKNSLDENLTFNIGILKILSGNRELKKDIEKPKLQKQTPKKECVYTNITEEEDNSKKQVNSKKAEKVNPLDMEDIGDIFPGTTEPKGEKIKENENKFNKKDFFEKLKSQGVKGMIISSLKASEITLNKSVFSIKFKTQFVQKQFNTTDNIAILKKILEDMGQKDIQIKLI